MACTKFGKGDVVGIAVDYTGADPKVSLYKNGVLIDSYDVPASGNDVIPAVSMSSGSGTNVTFLTYKSVIEYSVPSGYLPLDDDNGYQKTEYMSVNGYIDPDPSNPSPNVYVDNILDFPIFKRSVTVGFSSKGNQSFGDVHISNLDGERDDWLDRSWGGREVRIFYGNRGWKKSDFRLVSKAIAHEMVATSQDLITLKLRDKSALLSNEIKMNRYTSGDSEGDPIPLCYGNCYQVTPKLIDSALGKYQVHDGKIKAITAVYDNGLKLDTSQYSVDVDNGTFTLNQASYGTITADVQGSLHPTLNGDGTSTCDGNIFGGSGVSTQHILSIGSYPNTQTIISNGYSSFKTSTSFRSHGGGMYTVNFKILSGYSSGALVDDVWIGVANRNYDNGKLSTSSGAVGICCNGDTIQDSTVTTGGGTPFSVGDIVTLLVDLTGNTVSYKINNGSVSVLGTLDAGRIAVSLKNGFGVEIDNGGNFYAPEIGYTDCWETVATQPTYSPTASNIIFDILSRKSDLNYEDFDLSSLDKFASDFPQSMGLYITDPTPINSILDQIVNSFGAMWAFNRSGKIVFRKFVDPNGVGITPKDVLILDDDIVVKRLTFKNRILPYKRLTVGYKRFWTTLDKGGIAGAVLEAADTSSDEQNSNVILSIQDGVIYIGGLPHSTIDPTLAENLTKEYRYTSVSNNNTGIQHSLAQVNDSWNTLLEYKNQAEDIANYKLDIHSKIRNIYQIELNRNIPNIDIGDIIQIKANRFGFENTKNALVIGISDNFKNDTTVLEVWL